MVKFSLNCNLFEKLAKNHPFWFRNASLDRMVLIEIKTFDSASKTSKNCLSIKARDILT